MKPPDSILDDPFHAAAWEAFVIEARRRQGWPDSGDVKREAYRIYEAGLAERKGRPSDE